MLIGDDDYEYYEYLRACILSFIEIISLFIWERRTIHHMDVCIHKEKLLKESSDLRFKICLSIFIHIIFCKHRNLLKESTLFYLIWFYKKPYFIFIHYSLYKWLKLWYGINMCVILHNLNNIRHNIIVMSKVSLSF